MKTKTASTGSSTSIPADMIMPQSTTEALYRSAMPTGSVFSSSAASSTRAKM